MALQTVPSLTFCKHSTSPPF